MKYAAEVIGILPAYPGREWKAGQLIKEVLRGKEPTPSQVQAARKGIKRVLDDLVDGGFVERGGGNTRSAVYVWRGMSRPRANSSCEVGRQLRQ